MAIRKTTEDEEIHGRVKAASAAMRAALEASIREDVPGYMAERTMATMHLAVQLGRGPVDAGKATVQDFVHMCEVSLLMYMKRRD